MLSKRAGSQPSEERLRKNSVDSVNLDSKRPLKALPRGDERYTPTNSSQMNPINLIAPITGKKNKSTFLINQQASCHASKKKLSLRNVVECYTSSVHEVHQWA